METSREKKNKRELFEVELSMRSARMNMFHFLFMFPHLFPFLFFWRKFKKTVERCRKYRL